MGLCIGFQLSVCGQRLVCRNFLLICKKVIAASHPGCLDHIAVVLYILIHKYLGIMFYLSPNGQYIISLISTNTCRKPLGFLLILLLYLNHTWPYLGLTSGSVFRDYS